MMPKRVAQGALGGVLALFLMVSVGAGVDSVERFEVRDVKGVVERAAGPADLLGMAAKDRVSVRTLRAFGRLPDEFGALALALRSAGVDLLGAGIPEVTDLVVAAEQGQINVDPETLRRLLALLENRGYLDWQALQPDDALDPSANDLLRGKGQIVLQRAMGDSVTLELTGPVRAARIVMVDAIGTPAPQGSQEVEHVRSDQGQATWVQAPIHTEVAASPRATAEKGGATDEELTRVIHYLRGIHTIGDGLDEFLELGLASISAQHGVAWWQVFETFLAAEEVGRSLRSEDYAAAARTAAVWSMLKVAAQDPALANLLGVTRIAKLAALPIGLSLQSFAEAVSREGTRRQVEAYFVARAEPYNLSHDDILNSRRPEVVRGVPSAEIFFSDAGWFYILDGENVARPYGPLQPTRLAPSEVFSAAEVIYEAKQEEQRMRQRRDQAARTFAAELRELLASKRAAEPSPGVVPPAEVAPGTAFEVDWEGPNHSSDYITIVPTDAPEGRYLSYAYTNRGSPALLTAPREPGVYEVRYVLGTGARTLASAPIEVVAVAVTEQAAEVVPPAEVAPRAAFEVDWKGPDHSSDYITIVPAAAPEGRYLSWAYTNRGSPARLTAPREPGDYEVRYVLGRGDRTLASATVEVVDVSGADETADMVPPADETEVHDVLGRGDRAVASAPTEGVHATASPAMAEWLEAREAVLRRIIETHPHRDFRGCAPAYGPIEPEDWRQLFEGMVLTVRHRSGRESRRPMTTTILNASRFCLTGNQIWCRELGSTLYYCPTDEAPFINRHGISGLLQVTQIEPQKQPSSIRGRKVSQVFGSDDRVIPVEGRTCTIYAGWDEPTTVRWSGECIRGKASGIGLLEWVRDEKVIQRTRVGPKWGTELDEGALRIDINLDEFDFTLRECVYRSRNAHPEVVITAPPGTPSAFFENTWIVDELMRLGAEFAQSVCPPRPERYSNFSVEIRAAENVVVNGSSNNNKFFGDQDKLTWRVTNRAVLAFQREQEQAERARVAAERQLQAQARADALAAEFQARRGALETETRHFLNTGHGTLEDLAAALHLEQIAALGRLEQGIQLQIGPARTIDTVEHDGATHYRVEYSVRSRFARLESEFRQKRGFRWENWMSMPVSNSVFRFGCLFGSAHEIPRQEQEVTARLAAFGTDFMMGDTLVSLLCRP